MRSPDGVHAFTLQREVAANTRLVLLNNLQCITSI